VHETERRDSVSLIVAFVAVAYGLSVALSLAIGLTGGASSPLIGLQFLPTFMPALAVLSVRSRVGGDLDIDWHRLPWRYVPIALFLLPVVMHAAMLPVIVTYEGKLPWEDWLTPQAGGLFHSPAERGWGVLTPSALAGRIALNAITGLVVVSTLTFFEEIGWRGWLLPRLMDHIGARRAVVVTSAIWACWHIPFQLSGIQHIDGVSPLMLALTLPFGIFATGLVIGWLWLRTESIWIVSLAHGALNNWGQYALKYMEFVKTPDSVVGTAGLLATLATGIALLLWGLGPPQAAQKRG
jgi:membrane protease YdiL (CAAX protease family)